MKWAQPRLIAFCTGALVAMATPAFAQPKDKGHEGATAAAHSAMAHAAHEAREAHEEGKGDPKHSERPDEAGERGHGAEGAEHGKGDAGLTERMEKLRETRRDRRHARVEALKQKWGDALDRTDVREALKVHEWRMARLNRMRSLLEASDRPNKDKAIAKLDKLIEKENARFDKKMTKLKSAPAPGASAAASAMAAGSAAPKAAPPGAPTPAPAAPKGGAQ